MKSFFIIMFSIQFFSVSAYSMARIVCNDSGKIYKVCEDQKKIFQDNAKSALDSQKLMLITFGADWCPWCKSMNLILNDTEFWSELSTRFVKSEIALYESDSRKAVESGVGVFDDLLKANNKKREDYKSIPLLAVVDPTTSKAVFIKTGDLEKNSENQKSHDKEQIKIAVFNAADKLQPLQ